MFTFRTIKAGQHALSRLNASCSLGRFSARQFACLSVHVSCTNRLIPLERFKPAFEKVGKVWDVIPAESKNPGTPFTQASVRFYDGEFKPSASPGYPPLSLPPPTSAEVEVVTGYVQAAVEQLNRSVLDDVSIYVSQPYDNNPDQLHKWYEDMRVTNITQNNSTVAQYQDIFPINPFRKQEERVDDYQAGFRKGFLLGIKDGAKDVS